MCCTTFGVGILEAIHHPLDCPASRIIMACKVFRQSWILVWKTRRSMNLGRERDSVSAGFNSPRWSMSANSSNSRSSSSLFELQKQRLASCTDPWNVRRPVSLGPASHRPGLRRLLGYWRSRWRSTALASESACHIVFSTAQYARCQRIIGPLVTVLVVFNWNQINKVKPNQQKAIFSDRQFLLLNIFNVHIVPSNT